MPNYSTPQCPYCESELSEDQALEIGEAAGMIHADDASDYCECDHNDFVCPNDPDDLPEELHDWAFFRDLRAAFNDRDKEEFERLIEKINFSE